MSENPFRALARNYPYSEELELCEEDRILLVQGMIERIQDLLGWNLDYNETAAHQMIYLKIDYGLVFAAAFWQGITKIKGIKLGPKFFQYEIEGVDSVQAIVKEAVALMNHEAKETSETTALTLVSDNDVVN